MRPARNRGIGGLLVLVLVGVATLGPPGVARAQPAPDEQGSRFYARRYLTDTEALRLQMNRPSDEVAARRIVLGDSEIRQLRRRLRVKFYTDTYRVFALKRGGDADPYRYVMHLKQPGQHEFMDLTYGVDPDGTIHRIDLRVYREPHGGEVVQRRFMRQFEGRSLESSAFRVNMDVVHIVGATISSKSVARGARKALGILQSRGLTR